jgi:hypothetical protein
MEDEEGAMRGGRGRWTRVILTSTVATVLATTASAADAAAQRRDRTPPDQEVRPSAWVGVEFIAADPVGDFGVLVDDGYGLELEGRFPIGLDGALALRLDGGFIVYGHESRGMCFPPPVGCRIGVDLTTTNNIAFVGIGPELAVPGRISPYVNGSVGLSWFATQSSLSGLDDYEERFNTRNYSDLVTAARVGGGLRLRVARTSKGPILLDLGGTYHRNGVAEYLREGDILDHPDGSIELFPNRSEANLVVFRAGLSFGLGGGHADDRRRGRSRR